MGYTMMGYAMKACNVPDPKREDFQCTSGRKGGCGGLLENLNRSA